MLNDTSLLIIAGGKSSRLGSDKRFVEVGGVGLLENILRKAAAQNFAEKFLCVEAESPSLKLLATRYGTTLLIDTVKDSGAMTGLADGLARIKTDWALAVSCDMPFFEFDVLSPLLKQTPAQAIIPLVGGRKQMLAAFYRKELTEVFTRSLCGGQRKIFSAIKDVPHEIIELPDGANFFNVNSLADLRLARGRAENLRRETPIIAIVAAESGTGKTTFIEALIKKFAAQGIRVGVIKSDAHGITLDAQGKDSYRFGAAGARSVAVVSPGGWLMIQKTQSRADFASVAEKMTDVDLILTESRTHGTCPAISLWRGFGEPLVDDTTVALFTAEPVDDVSIRQFDLNDSDAAARLCKFLAL